MLHRKIDKEDPAEQVSKRSEKLSSEMLHAMGSILKDSYSQQHPTVLLTVTEVELSDDLRDARIFCSLFSGDDAAKDALFQTLLRDLKKIRHQLAGKIVVKYMPRISFVKDTSLENAERINRLLRDL